MERYLYEAILTPSETGGYDVLIPDIGLKTTVVSLEDAAYAAEDLIEKHISDGLIKGYGFPKVGSFDHTIPKGSMALGISAVVEA